MNEASRDDGSDNHVEGSDDDVVVDSRGTLCPQPVIDLGRAMADRPHIGQSLTLLADDPAALHDVPAWCRMRGCEWELEELDDGSYRFRVTRSNAP